MEPAIPSPSYQTSLLTAQHCGGHVHLILGTNPLAASRATQSLASGAKPVLIAPIPAASLHYGLAAHIASGAVEHLERAFQENDLFTLGRPEVDRVVDAVFITSARNLLAPVVSALCRRHRIPVNVVDAPALCTFSLLSTHVDGPLQIGVTTNGRGCKLASRIRREVAASLPSSLGSACALLGDMRRRIIDEDCKARALRAEAEAEAEAAEEDEGVDDSVDQTATFNKLILDADDADAVKSRRMRWLAQVCEYWPLKRLASVTEADVDSVLKSFHAATATPDLTTKPPGHRSQPKLGRIILAGSGPGHPDLLTLATHKALLTADLILADKLVPSPVLDLIPRRTPVTIARKFPGNADRAQDELLSLALAGVSAGKTVLRLKQGDPFIYGRGGEEVAFFRAHGMGDRVTVLPGITSALSAPLFAGVPATQRDVSDQVLICTGTGKKGKAPEPPGWRAGRTVVFLMGLHRIGGLVAELTTWKPEEDAEAEAEAERIEGGKEVDGAAKVKGRSRVLWPLDTPCTVIERASCPDQRVIRTTLKHVAEAIEQEGSRPPGLLVVGKACEVLYTPEKGRSWVVEEGFRGLDLDMVCGLGLGEAGLITGKHESSAVTITPA